MVCFIELTLLLRPVGEASEGVTLALPGFTTTERVPYFGYRKVPATPRSGSGCDSTVAPPTTEVLRPPEFGERFRSAIDTGGTSSKPRLLVGAPPASGVMLLLRYFSTVHEAGGAPMASASKPPLTTSVWLLLPTEEETRGASLQPASTTSPAITTCGTRKEVIRIEH
jgi:hypothetical protein